MLQPLRASGWSSRHNFDGVLSYAFAGTDFRCYLQIFRTGAIEAVENYFFGTRDNGTHFIPSGSYERDLIDATKRFLLLQQQIGVDPPIVLRVTLTRVKGFVLGVSQPRFFQDKDNAIDREVLPLPEIVIEDYTTDASKALQPIFDTIWNATGWPRSLNYDEKGN